MTNINKSMNFMGLGGLGSRGQTDSMPNVAFTQPKLPRSIVIGTGFGGLAAAIRLSVKGYRVQVLE